MTSIVYAPVGLAAVYHAVAFKVDTVIIPNGSKSSRHLWRTAPRAPARRGLFPPSAVRRSPPRPRRGHRRLPARADAARRPTASRRPLRASARRPISLRSDIPESVSTRIDVTEPCLTRSPRRSSSRVRTTLSDSPSAAATRVRSANDWPIRSERYDVLYWMIAARRAAWDFRAHSSSCLPSLSL